MKNGNKKSDKEVLSFLSPLTTRLLAASLGILISSVSLEVALRLRKGELFSTENQILKKVRSRPNPCLSRLDSHLGWRTEANQSSSVPSKRELNKKSSVSSNHLPLQGVIIEITPDSIERTSRKGMLTSFFKKHITKPHYLLENGSLIGKSPAPLDPHYNYEQLSVLRRFLGYSYLFDFVFRKTALHWWWGIVDRKDYPKEFQTGESAEQTSCEILKEWRTKLASSKLLGVAVIQDYFKTSFELKSLDILKSCAQQHGFLIVDLRPPFLETKRKDPSLFSSFWISSKGGHLSARGNLEVAKEIGAVLQKQNTPTNK